MSEFMGFDCGRHRPGRGAVAAEGARQRRSTGSGLPSVVEFARPKNQLTA